MQDYVIHKGQHWMVEKSDKSLDIKVILLNGDRLERKGWESLSVNNFLDIVIGLEH